MMYLIIGELTRAQAQDVADILGIGRTFSDRGHAALPERQLAIRPDACACAICIEAQGRGPRDEG